MLNRGCSLLLVCCCVVCVLFMCVSYICLVCLADGVGGRGGNIKIIEKAQVFIFQRWDISQCRKIIYSPFGGHAVVDDNKVASLWCSPRVARNSCSATLLCHTKVPPNDRLNL